MRRRATAAASRHRPSGESKATPLKQPSRRPAAEVPYQFGVLIEPTLARRERFADRFDYDFGRERVFPELVEALLAELPERSELLEVGAATGLLTRPLLTKASKLTALEPSAGMLKRLLDSEVAADDRLVTFQGLAEDLPEDAYFDNAIVTFTPRRGMGLLHLLTELAVHVRNHVIMLLDEDGTLDWAYLARAAAQQGFDVRLRIVAGPCDEEDDRRAVVLVADVHDWCRESSPEGATWGDEARVLDMPYPAPRGAATRIMRYFLAGGDRALVVRTDPKGAERLYGNLRTAAHRLGRDEVTVRRTDEGVQIMRLPKTAE